MKREDLVNLRNQIDVVLRESNHALSICHGAKVKIKDGSYVVSMLPHDLTPKERGGTAIMPVFRDVVYTIVYIGEGLPSGTDFNKEPKKNNIMAVAENGAIIFCTDLNIYPVS